MFAAVALMFSVGMLLSCSEEQIDDWNADAACRDFCTKDFQCRSIDPTDDENSACVNNCRYYIEKQCGNEHQAAATDQMEHCVDQNCLDFYICMVFQANPLCFGFLGVQ